ncbi:MAG: hypothetical protein ACK57B_01385 [Betaproteobacteria bacterium]
MNAPAPFPQFPGMVPAPLVPLVAPVRLEQLRELSTWMALDGQRVSLQRLCMDRVYALEQLSRAHASDLEPLRELAVSLFAVFERPAATATH